MRIFPADQFKIERNVEYGTPEQNETVRQIVSDVAASGDEALLRYTAKFDNTTLTAEQLKVSEEDIQAAYEQVDSQFLKALQTGSGQYSILS